MTRTGEWDDTHVEPYDTNPGGNSLRRPTAALIRYDRRAAMEHYRLAAADARGDWTDVEGTFGQDRGLGSEVTCLDGIGTAVEAQGRSAGELRAVRLGMQGGAQMAGGARMSFTGWAHVF